MTRDSCLLKLAASSRWQQASPGHRRRSVLTGYVGPSRLANLLAGIRHASIKGPTVPPSRPESEQERTVGTPSGRTTRAAEAVHTFYLFLILRTGLRASNCPHVTVAETQIRPIRARTD